MAEREFSARAVSVDCICDKCGKGLMQPTGVMLMSDPPQWPHKCGHCADTQNFPHKYPFIRYKVATSTMD